MKAEQCLRRLTTLAFGTKLRQFEGQSVVLRSGLLDRHFSVVGNTHYPSAHQRSLWPIPGTCL